MCDLTSNYFYFKNLKFVIFQWIYTKMLAVVYYLINVFTNACVSKSVDAYV